MNVLFLMVDEMSWWALGHVNPAVHTPNLDGLAKRGVRFDAAYTPSPICVPARAAIATGRHVHEIGYWDSAAGYDGRIPSWGHALRAAGKRAVSIGKLHYRSGDDDTGFDRQIEPIHILNGKGWVQALLRRPVGEYLTVDSLARDIGPGDTDYLAFDRRVTEAAETWITAPQRKTEDWCAFVSWLAPHFPLIAPRDYCDLYDATAFESEAEPVPDHPILRELATYFGHDEYFSPETRGIARACYHALCSFVDAQAGRVLDALDRADLADDTLVLFTSDHGEMLGEKGFWTKSTMYDSAVRVPLIAAGPGIVPGVRNDPVSLVDIAPTICAAMGAQGNFAGQSLLAPPQPDRTVLSEYHDGGASVGITMVRWNTETVAWKFVHYAEGHAPQLFNLTDDPHETDDLSSACPGIVSEARQRLALHLDPEAANARAHADQARRIDVLGGRDALLATPQFDYTPADSR